MRITSLNFHASDVLLTINASLFQKLIYYSTLLVVYENANMKVQKYKLIIFNPIAFGLDLFFLEHI
jgi:hypothetical protein